MDPGLGAEGDHRTKAFCVAHSCNRRYQAALERVNNSTGVFKRLRKTTNPGTPESSTSRNASPSTLTPTVSNGVSVSNRTALGLGVAAKTSFLLR